MDEKLNWEKKEKLGINVILEQINSLTKQVIVRELTDIHSKIDTLHQMGLIKDDEKMNELKEKMRQMGLEAEAEVKK